VPQSRFTGRKERFVKKALRWLILTVAGVLALLAVGRIEEAVILDHDSIGVA
jgi:hypothetical protein